MGTHTVDIEFETNLASAIGRSTWVTNSHHHQSVKTVGKGLQVVARAKDGTVEGLEDSSYPWMVATQFHPEMMTPKIKVQHVYLMHSLQQLKKTGKNNGKAPHLRCGAFIMLYLFVIILRRSSSI